MADFTNLNQMHARFPSTSASGAPPAGTTPQAPAPEVPTAPEQAMADNGDEILTDAARARIENMDWKQIDTPEFPAMGTEMRGMAFEKQFRDEYAGFSEAYDLPSSPDDIDQQYDYRAAYAQGDLKMDADGKLPSKYKLAGHAQLIQPAEQADPDLLETGFLEIDAADGVGPAHKVEINRDTLINTSTGMPATQQDIDYNNKFKAWASSANRDKMVPTPGHRGALLRVALGENPDYHLMPTAAKNNVLKSVYEREGFLWDPDVEEAAIARKFESPYDKLREDSEMGPQSPEEQAAAVRAFSGKQTDIGASGPALQQQIWYDEELGMGDRVLQGIIGLGDPMSADNAAMADRHVARLVGSSERIAQTILKNAKTREAKEIALESKFIENELATKSGFSLEGTYVAAGMGALEFVNSLQNTASAIGITGAYLMGMEEEMRVMVDDVARRSSRVQDDHMAMKSAFDSDFYMDSVALTTQVGLDILTMSGTSGFTASSKAATGHALKAFQSAGKAKAGGTIARLQRAATTEGPFRSFSAWLAKKAMGVSKKEGLDLAEALAAKRGTKASANEWLVSQLTKPVAGYNPFVTRMAGNAAADSLVASEARASAEGRELGFGDFVWAAMDGMNMAAATWILHATGVAPTKLGMVKEGKKMFDSIPTSLLQATQLTTLRTAKYGLQGGAGFLAYEAVIEGWQLATQGEDGRTLKTDKDWYIDNLSKWAGEGGPGNKLHSFMLGAVQKYLFKGAGAIKTGGKDSAMRQYLEYAYTATGKGLGGRIPGRVAASAWKKMPRPMQERLLSEMSEAQRQALRENADRDIKGVTEGKIDLSHLTEDQLMDVVAFGDKKADDYFLAGMETGTLAKWTKKQKDENNRQWAWRHRYEKGANVKEGTAGTGQFGGVTKMMARAELAKRGIPGFAEVLRTTTGGRDYSTQTSAQRAATRAERKAAYEKAIEAQSENVRYQNWLKNKPNRPVQHTADHQSSRPKIVPMSEAESRAIVGQKRGLLRRLLEFTVPTEGKDGKTVVRGMRRITNADQLVLFDLYHAEAMEIASKRGDTVTRNKLIEERKKYVTAKGTARRVMTDKGLEAPGVGGRRRKKIKLNQPERGIEDSLAYRLVGPETAVNFMSKRGYKRDNSLANARIAIKKFIENNPEAAIAISESVKSGRNSEKDPVIGRKAFLDIVSGKEGERSAQLRGRASTQANNKSNRYLFAEAVARELKDASIQAPGRQLAEALGVRPAKEKVEFAGERTTSEMRQRFEEQRTERAAQERRAETAREMTSLDSQALKEAQEANRSAQETLKENQSEIAAEKRAEKKPEELGVVEQLEALREPTAAMGQNIPWGIRILGAISDYVGRLPKHTQETPESVKRRQAKREELEGLEGVGSESQKNAFFKKIESVLPFEAANRGEKSVSITAEEWVKKAEEALPEGFSLVEMNLEKAWDESKAFDPQSAKAKAALYAASDGAVRPTVVVKMPDGRKVPFYVSSGEGNKKEVATGYWYPFAGYGSRGFVVKTSGEHMARFYGDPALRKIAEALNGITEGVPTLEGALSYEIRADRKNRGAEKFNSEIGLPTPEENASGKKFAPGSLRESIGRMAGVDLSGKGMPEKEIRRKLGPGQWERVPVPYRIVTDSDAINIRPNHSVVMKRARARGVSVAYVEIIDPALRSQAPERFVTEEGVIVFRSDVDPVTAMNTVGEHIALSKINKGWKKAGLEDPLGPLLSAMKSSDEARLAAAAFMMSRYPELESATGLKGLNTIDKALRLNLRGGSTTVDGTPVQVETLAGLRNDLGRMHFFHEMMQAMPMAARSKFVHANKDLMAKYFVEMRAAYEDLGFTSALPLSSKSKSERNIFGTMKTNEYIDYMVAFGSDGAEANYTRQAVSKKGKKFKATSFRKNHAMRAMAEMFDVIAAVNGDHSIINARADVQRRVGLERFGTKRRAKDETLKEAEEFSAIEQELGGLERERREAEQDRVVFDETSQAFENASETIALNTGKKYLRHHWNRLQDMFPGITEPISRLLKKAQPGEMAGFNYDGHTFYMMVDSATHKGKKRKIVKAITYIDHEAAAAADPNTILKLSDREFRVYNKMAEMAHAAEKFRNEGSEKPLDPSGPEKAAGAAEKPPAEKPPAPPSEGTGAPEPAPEPSSRRTADLVGPRAILERIERMAGKYIRDPLNRALTKHDDLYLEATESFIDLDLRYSGMENQTRMDIEKGIRRLASLSNSSLVESSLLGSKQVKSKDAFAKILDAYIDPAKIESNPLTKGLLKVEQDVIRDIKVLDEKLRQELIADHREAARLKLNNTGSADRIVKMLNKEFDSKVELAKGKKGQKKFRHEGIELGREEFIEYAIKNIMVKDSWGKEYSHFPHYFLGNWTIKITAKQGDGEPALIQKGGSTPMKGLMARAKGSEYKLALADAKRRVAELKESIENPGDVTFEFTVEKVNRAISTEVMYLPKKTRRRIEKAAKEHTDGLHRSDLTRALASGLQLRQTPKPFFGSVMERSQDSFGWSNDVMNVMAIYLSGHYRYMKGREFQKTIDPKIDKIEMYDEALAADLRDMSRHILYSDRGAIAGALAGGPTEGISQGIVKTAQFLRSVQFYRHLPRVAQNLINSTQISQVATVTGVRNAAKYAGEYNFNPKMRKEVLENWGSFDAYGKWKDGKFGDVYSSRMINGLETLHYLGNKVTGKLFNVSSEARNQNASFYALFRHAQEKLGKEGADAARFARIYGQVFTQYRFTKANDPKILRGQVAKTMGQFKRFPIQTLGMAYSFARMDRATADRLGIDNRGKALATWMSSNLLLAGYKASVMGALASTGIGATKWSYDQIMKGIDDTHVPSEPWIGMDPGMDTLRMHKVLPDHLEPIADALMYGPASLFGIDFSASFAMLELPYGKTVWDRFAQLAGGPSGSMFKRLFTDTTAPQARPRALHNRLASSFVESSAALKPFLRAVEAMMFWNELGSSTEYQDILFGSLRAGAAKRDRHGFLIAKKSKEQQIINMLGARSMEESQLDHMYVTGIFLQENVSEALDRMATVYRGGAEGRKKAREMMGQWNRDYARIPGMAIDFTDISARVENKRRGEIYTRDQRQRDRRMGAPAEAMLNYLKDQ